MRTLAATVVLISLAACGDTPAQVTGCDGGACSDGGTPLAPTASNIRHLVVVIQENHSFDNYFATWCRAPTGSNPTCNEGPSCCEAGPSVDPGTGMPPVVLDDKENGTYTPDHHQACELDEIDGGAMDRFSTSSVCGSPHNFAYVDEALAAPYRKLAATYAIADRYFQPIAGESASNDMYFARAREVFIDNTKVPMNAIDANCEFEGGDPAEYLDETIGDLLTDAGVSWAMYIGGYQEAVTAAAQKKCPDLDPGCPGDIPIYPCIYEPTDVPFQFYPRFRDDPQYMRDYSAFAADLAADRLPSVSWLRAIGWKSEHPTAKTTLSDGIAWVTEIIDAVAASPEASSTLVLFTYDESGGYFDHVAPPGISPGDSQPYGARVPFLAIGPFAKRAYVSHVQMEHSSIVQFIEWNWLSGVAGQPGPTGGLFTRDALVHNIGSMLDPAATGIAVPE